MEKIKIAKILEYFGDEVTFIGDVNFYISGFNNIKDAKTDEISFCSYSDDKFESTLNNTKSQCIFIRAQSDNIIEQYNNKNLIISKDPKADMISFLNYFTKKPLKMGIHPSAILGENVNVSINVYIGPNVVVGDNVIIGENTKIFGNVTLYDDVKIGKDCIINSGTVIGADGFGYIQNEGTSKKFPHFGSVIIHDFVEIGSNTSIDRGSLSNTIIHNHVKIDNLVHIAHNVVIHSNSFIIANSMIGGSTIIEKNSWIAPSSSIMNGITIGENNLVGIGTVVLKTTDKNSIIVGVPGKLLKKRK